jgi:hypothetical protein
LVLTTDPFSDTKSFPKLLESANSATIFQSGINPYRRYVASTREAVMDIQKLAEQLAGLRFQSGHAFDNGTPFYETLSKESAEGLLRALQSKGYVLGRETFASPSIAPEHECISR